MTKKSLDNDLIEIGTVITGIYNNINDSCGNKDEVNEVKNVNQSLNMKIDLNINASVNGTIIDKANEPINCEADENLLLPKSMNNEYQYQKLKLCSAKLKKLF